MAFYSTLIFQWGVILGLFTVSVIFTLLALKLAGDLPVESPVPENR